MRTLPKSLLGAAFAAALFATTSASAFMLGPTTPGKWGPPAFGTGATVTYSYMANGVSCVNEPLLGCSISAISTFMPMGAKTAIDAAFAAWTAVADITFMETLDAGEAFNAVGASGDIRIGGHTFDGPGGTISHGFFPPPNGVSAAGDFHFDTAELWKIGFGGPGFDIFQVAAHEIGHAIGLDHTSVPMSLLNPSYTEAFSGPQADDIAGAQFIYGASQAVPEPSVLVLVSIGLIGLGFVRRRVAAGH